MVSSFFKPADGYIWRHWLVTVSRFFGAHPCCISFFSFCVLHLYHTLAWSFLFVRMENWVLTCAEGQVIALDYGYTVLVIEGIKGIFILHSFSYLSHNTSGISTVRLLFRLQCKQNYTRGLSFRPFVRAK